MNTSPQEIIRQQLAALGARTAHDALQDMANSVAWATGSTVPAALKTILAAHPRIKEQLLSELLPTEDADDMESRLIGLARFRSAVEGIPFRDAISIVLSDNPDLDAWYVRKGGKGCDQANPVQEFGHRAESRRPHGQARWHPPPVGPGPCPFP